MPVLNTAMDHITNEYPVLLQELNQEFGKTLVMVTHDDEATERASRVIHIRDGKIVGR